jgi:hypothetical protein
MNAFFWDSAQAGNGICANPVIAPVKAKDPDRRKSFLMDSLRVME